MKKRKRAVPPSATADAHLLASPVDVPSFTTTDPWRVLRIEGEFVRGFDALADVGRAVTIFGSARTPAGSPEYEAARETARLLGKKGFTLGEPLVAFQGVLRGVPTLVDHGAGLLPDDRE